MSTASPQSASGLLATQAHVSQGSSLDRDLRAYFLLASDARRLARLGQTGAAGALCASIEGAAQALDAGSSAARRLAKAGFAAVDDVLALLDASGPSPAVRVRRLVRQMNEAGQ